MQKVEDKIEDNVTENITLILFPLEKSSSLVIISQGSSEKLPLTQWLKTVIHSLTVLESKIKVSAVLVTSGDSEGESILFLDGCWRSSAFLGL